MRIKLRLALSQNTAATMLAANNQGVMAACERDQNSHPEKATPKNTVSINSRIS